MTSETSTRLWGTPTAMDVVAGLFLGKGLVWAILAVAEAADTHVIHTGTFLVAFVMMVIGCALARFDPSAREPTMTILFFGVLFRLGIVLTLGLFLADRGTEKPSRLSLSELRQGSYSSYRLWSVERYKKSTSGEVEWFVKTNGEPRHLRTAEAYAFGSFILLGAGLNLWQLIVLRRPAVRSMFAQPSTVSLLQPITASRLLLPSVLFAGVYLAIWKISDGLIFL